MNEFDYAPGWYEEPGDVIRGTVTELGERTGNYAPYPVVTLDVEEGTEVRLNLDDGAGGRAPQLVMADGETRAAIHASSTAIRNQLAELDVQVGDQIKVWYGGKGPRKSGEGDDVHKFRVRRTSDTGFDWGNGTKAAPGDEAALSELAQKREALGY